MTAKRIPLIIVFLLLPFSIFSQVDCKSSFEVAEFPSEGVKADQLKIAIKTSAGFNCELIAFSGIKQKSVRKISGFGNEELILKDLSPDFHYTVVVAFENEQTFFCKKRVIDAIIIKPESN